MRRVGHDGAARVDPRGRHAVLFERRRHDAAVDQFARADNRVVGARGRRAKDAGGFEQRAQIVELRGDLDEHAVGGIGRQQPLDRFEVTARQLGDAVEDVRVAPAFGRLGQFEQPIRHTAHRGDDDDRRQPGALPRGPDDSDDAGDGVGVRDRACPPNFMTMGPVSAARALDRGQTPSLVYPSGSDPCIVFIQSFAFERQKPSFQQIPMRSQSQRPRCQTLGQSCNPTTGVRPRSSGVRPHWPLVAHQ